MAVPSDFSWCSGPDTQYALSQHGSAVVDPSTSPFILPPEFFAVLEGDELDIPANFFNEPEPALSKSVDEMPKSVVVPALSTPPKKVDRKRKPGAIRGKEFVWETALREAGSDEHTAQELHATLIENAISPLHVLSLQPADLASALRSINIRPAQHHALVGGAAKQAQPAPIKVRKKERQKKDGTTKKPVDPNKPKKPLSSYVFFCKAKRMDTRAAHPELRPVEIESLLGRLWNELPRDARSHWEQLARQDVVRYRSELEAYQAALQAQQQPQIGGANAADGTQNFDGMSEMYRESTPASAADATVPVSDLLSTDPQPLPLEHLLMQAGEEDFFKRFAMAGAPFSPMVQQGGYAADGVGDASSSSLVEPTLSDDQFEQRLDEQFADQVLASDEAFRAAASQLPFHNQASDYQAAADADDALRLASQLPFHLSDQVVFGLDDARRLSTSLPFHAQTFDPAEALRLAQQLPFHLSEQMFGSEKALRLATQLPLRPAQPTQPPTSDAESRRLAAQLPFFRSDRVMDNADDPSRLAVHLPFHASDQVLDEIALTDLFASSSGRVSPLSSYGLCGLVSLSGVELSEGDASAVPFDESVLLSGRGSPPPASADPFGFGDLFDPPLDGNA